MAIPPLTLSEIDVALVAVRWKWLHAIWAGREIGVQLAEVEQNALLEQRFALAQAAAQAARIEPEAPAPA
jgi:hypothetical protein